MGLCFSRKKRTLYNDDSRFIIIQDAPSFLKQQTPSDEQVRSTNNIELLYERPVYKYTTETASSSKDKKCKISHTIPLERPKLETLTKLAHNCNSSSAKTTISLVSQNVEVLHIGKKPYPLKERNRSKRCSKEAAAQPTLQSPERCFNKPNTSEPHSSRVSSKPNKKRLEQLSTAVFSKEPAVNLKVVSFQDLELSRFPDDNETTYVSAMLFKKSPFLRKLFNKISPKKKEPIENCSYETHYENGQLITYRSITLQTELLEESDASLNFEQFPDYGLIPYKLSSMSCEPFESYESTSVSYEPPPNRTRSVPYQSSSLMIMPSRSFFENEQLSEIDLRMLANHMSHCIVTEYETTNKLIQTSSTVLIKITKSFSSTTLCLLQLSGDTECPEKVVLTVRPNKGIETRNNSKNKHSSRLDPSRKMIKILQSRYNKKFKTMDELLQLPPKDLILFITSGELPDTYTSIQPTKFGLNYKQFLKSITSGI